MSLGDAMCLVSGGWCAGLAYGLFLDQKLLGGFLCVGLASINFLAFFS